MATTIEVTQSADIVLIAGSPVAASRSAAALEYVDYALRAEAQTTHILYARELLATALTSEAPYEHPAIQKAVTAVVNARGVVIATPIYKAAYSGVLKTFLDLLPQDGLAGKAVFPIATGGSLAHLLAIDYALKPVLTALGARHILQGVYLTDAQITRVTGSRTAYSNAYRIEEDGEARLLDGATTLLHALYGPTLLPAREAGKTGKDLAVAGR